MSNEVLEFQQVTVVYPNGKRALCEITFSVEVGECLALVGESGCGKSTLARTALGILQPKTKVSSSIFIDGIQINGATDSILKRLRGLVVGFVAQDPFSACNPLATVGDFVSEAWRVHSLVPPKNAVRNSLKNLGIENTHIKIKQFPISWSGGMLQRAGIAAATAHLPKLIIADEPTSSLDSELNEVVLESLKKSRTAILLISHDLRLVEKFADRIVVMKDGKIIEIGATKEIFQNPKHQYTIDLLECSKPNKTTESKNNHEPEIILEAKNLGHNYGQNRLFDNINLQINRGEIIGICGASGCGKSTLLRLLMNLETPQQGEVLVNENQNQTQIKRNGFMIPIFQDSVASLDRYWSVWRIITEPLTAKHQAKKFSKAERISIARQKLNEVGLENINLNSRPTELSVGQCQRIAIARAFTSNAKIILADEPTSSLDVLNSEQIMKLFVEKAEQGTTVIIVSHNKELLYRFCKRVFHLTNGELIQRKEKENVYRNNES